MTTQALPTLFVPHGSGPCFFMDWEPADTWARMERWLRSVPELVGARPKAVLVVSGHWEAPGGRAAHPREEYLLPLHVAAGAAGDDAGRRVFQDRVLGSMQSAYIFGD